MAVKETIFEGVATALITPMRLIPQTMKLKQLKNNHKEADNNEIELQR